MTHNNSPKEKSLNPFFAPFNTPHDTAPFDRLTVEDYREAILEGMKREDAEIDAIVNDVEAPTFDNTIVALTEAGELLGTASTVFFNLLSAETTDEMDALAQELSPILSEHENNISLNEQLFARIRAVHDAPLKLDDEERMLLDKTYEGFERSGATLPEEGKQQLRELTKELSMLTLQFSQNCLKETNAFELFITDADDLKGLPETQVEQARQTALEKGHDGWCITLQAPSYGPFMSHADNRELRRRLYMAQNTKCVHKNEFNNLDIVKRIVNLRREIAQLLGYKSFAEYALKRRMAEKIENVNKLLDELIVAYRIPAEEEVEAIAQLAKRNEGDDFELQPWDYAYYSHRLQLERYNLDSEMLRPYFELSQVEKGVFGLATRLYGITFEQNKSIPVYHPDVKAYDVKDADGSFLAVLYTDFHPRKGKRDGAWMTSYREQRVTRSGENVRPHVSVTMNLTKPTPTKPALLTLGEVNTFLHEFGHALHGMFASTRFEALSGTNVYWDFVELPSQFMENFALERDFLRTFAFHYQTGEVIPDELIERIHLARNYGAAYGCMRQVSFGLLDMAYYTMEEPFDEDVMTFERKAWQRAILLPQIEGTCMIVCFSHIMAGGYAAGYYSYKWAEVLDADAFAAFQEEGIFNRATAQRFRDCILSKGGTEPPMELYKRFRGKEPSIDALLKRDGIKKK